PGRSARPRAEGEGRSPRPATVRGGPARRGAERPAGGGPRADPGGAIRARAAVRAAAGRTGGLGRGCAGGGGGGAPGAGQGGQVCGSGAAAARAARRQRPSAEGVRACDRGDRGGEVISASSWLSLRVWPEPGRTPSARSRGRRRGSR